MSQCDVMVSTKHRQSTGQQHPRLFITCLQVINKVINQYVNMLICYSLGMNNVNNVNNYPAPVLPKLVLSVIGTGAGNGTGTATYPRAVHSDYCALACV